MKHNVRKPVALLLALLMAFGLFPNVSAASHFTDVDDGSWYAPFVQYVYEYEPQLMNGMTETTFEPQTTCSRAMATVVIYRLSSEVATTTATYTDLDPNMSWYQDGIAWAQQTGVVNGVGDNRFDPDGGVTREQLVTMLWRYAGKPAAQETDLSAFADGSAVGSFAKDAVAWAVANALLQGDRGSLYPQRIATRAEFAKLLTVFTGLEAHEHTWDDGKVTKEPTCTAAGEMTYTCTVCGETRTEEIPALGHIDEDPKDGKCDRCGEAMDHTHAWDDGKVTKEATCTAAGETTYTCTVCGETRTEEIAPLGHNWDNGKITEEANCTDSGVKTFTCTRCGETRTEEIPALGHIDENPKDGKCDRCGAWIDENTATITLLCPEGTQTFERHIGSIFTFPGCDWDDPTYTFVGWVPAEVEQESDLTKLNVHQKDDTLTVSADQTFHALFSYASEEKTKFYRPDTVSDYTGDWAIVGMNSASTLFYAPDADHPQALGSNAELVDVASDLPDVEVSDRDGDSYTEFYTGDTGIRFHITREEDGTYYIENRNSSYLAWDGSDGLTLAEGLTDRARWNISYVGGARTARVFNVQDPNMVLVYNNDDKAFEVLDNTERLYGVEPANYYSLWLYLADSAAGSLYTTNPTPTPKEAVFTLICPEGTETFDVTVGDTFTFPGCGWVDPSYTFVGWTTKEVASADSLSNLTVYREKETLTVSGSATFYALFGTAGEGALRYHTTDTVTDYTGDWALIGLNSASSILYVPDYAHPQAFGEDGTQIDVASAFSDIVVGDLDGDGMTEFYTAEPGIRFTIAAEEAGGYSIRTQDGAYLCWDGDDGLKLDGALSDSARWTISYVGGARSSQIFNLANSRMVIVYNIDTKAFEVRDNTELMPGGVTPANYYPMWLYRADNGASYTTAPTPTELEPEPVPATITLTTPVDSQDYPVFVDDEFTFPACPWTDARYRFVGWTDAEAEHLSEDEYKTLRLYQPEEKLTVTGDATYYALFAVPSDETRDTTKYEQLRATREDYTGTWALVGHRTEGPVAMKPDGSRLELSTLEDVVISEDYSVFYTDEESIRFTFAKDENGDYTIQNQNGEYLCWNGNELNAEVLFLEEPNEYAAWTVLSVEPNGEAQLRNVNSDEQKMALRFDYINFEILNSVTFANRYYYLFLHEASAATLSGSYYTTKPDTTPEPPAAATVTLSTPGGKTENALHVGDEFTFPVCDWTDERYEFVGWADAEAEKLTQREFEALTLHQPEETVPVTGYVTYYALFAVRGAQTVSTTKYELLTATQDDYNGVWAISGRRSNGPVAMTPDGGRLELSTLEDATIAEDYSEFCTNEESIRFTFTEDEDGNFTIQNQAGQYLCWNGSEFDPEILFLETPNGYAVWTILSVESNGEAQLRNVNSDEQKMTLRFDFSSFAMMNANTFSTQYYSLYLYRASVSELSSDYYTTNPDTTPAPETAKLTLVTPDGPKDYETTVGAEFTFPACEWTQEGYTFVGWTETDIAILPAAQLDTLTVYRENDMLNVTQSATYHALFAAQSDEAGAGYRMLTAAQEDYSGVWAIAGIKSTTGPWVMKQDGSAVKVSELTDVSLESDNSRFTASDTDFRFTFTPCGDGVYTIQNAAEQYLAWNGSEYGSELQFLSEQNNYSKWKITEVKEDGKVQLRNMGTADEKMALRFEDIYNEFQIMNSNTLMNDWYYLYLYAEESGGAIDHYTTQPGSDVPPSATVTLSYPGGTTEESVTVGKEFTFPACKWTKENYTFVGWTAENNAKISVEDFDALTVYREKDTVEVQDDVTYYALFAAYNSVPLEKTNYQLLTAERDDYSGVWAIGGSTGANPKLLDQDDAVITVSDEKYDADIDAANKSFSTKDASIRFTFTSAGDNAYYIQNAKGQYIAWNGNDDSNYVDLTYVTAPDEAGDRAKWIFMEVPSSGQIQLRCVANTDWALRYDDDWSRSPYRFRVLRSSYSMNRWCYLYLYAGMDAEVSLSHYTTQPE